MKPASHTTIKRYPEEVSNIGGGLETPVDVLERLFHLCPHVTLADTVAVDVAGARSLPRIDPARFYPLTCCMIFVHRSTIGSA
jgi:hypothetical protein